jgi:carbonic anhydrase/acetyltransferase-like protein (isoleucine patch superfamily)
MQPYIAPFHNIHPILGKNVFVAPGAVVVGDVVVGDESNIWFGCAMRGDVNTIRIGSRTNIQDGTIIHVTRKTGPTVIGSGITIGHRALLHACTLEDDCFIGMGAILLDDVVVERGAMVAAGALVTPGKRVPSGQLWAGSPAKYFRDLTEAERNFIPQSAQNYVELARAYLGLE